MDAGWPKVFLNWKKIIVTEAKNVCYDVLGADLTIVSVLILGDEVFLTSGQDFR